MAALKIVLTIVFILISIVMIVIVLMQEGKTQGLGSIGGGSDTFWGKNKSRSVEGKLEKYTKFGAALFLILALVLNMI